jgi:hypothetical protein
MKIGLSLRNLNLKSPVLSGLTGLAGFVAGVLVAGLISLEQTPSSQAAQAPGLPASSIYVPRAEPIPVQDPTPAVTVAPWAFESVTAAPARDPGLARPDRLSAPEGWTYAPGGPTD